MGKLRMMGPEAGDEPLTWDPQNEKETEDARKTFEEYIGKGYAAYRVEQALQRKGEPVSEFDPQESEYLLAAPVAGG